MCSSAINAAQDNYILNSCPYRTVVWVFMLLCVSFSMKNGMTLVTQHAFCWKISWTHLTFHIYLLPDNPTHPPPPPPPHTHTHTQLSEKDKQTDTEDFRCQEYWKPNTFGEGGGIYLRCTSEIYLLMIWELVRYWLYYNFAFSRMRLSGKQFTSKPWISQQLPTRNVL